LSTTLRNVSVNTMATLPEVPGLEDLASAWMSAHPRDLMFQPPSLKNGWGQAQVGRCVTAVQAITFPPHACGCGADDPWISDYLTTGEIYFDDELLTAQLGPRERIRFRWQPHRVMRQLEWNGWRIETETCMPWDTTALLQRIRVTRTGETITTAISFHPGTAPGTFARGESVVHPVCETHPQREWDTANALYCSHDRTGVTHVCEGVLPAPDGGPRNGLLRYIVHFDHAQTREWVHLISCAESAAAALAQFNRLRADPAAALRAHADAVAHQIAAAFTPGNDCWSGHLPVLHTANPDLWKLYHSALATLWSARAEAPTSRLGRVYRAIGPRIHATRIFPWDTALCAHTLAQLDPDPLQRALLHWLEQPLDRHSHSCFLNGRMFGNWYPANHWSMIQIARALAHTRDSQAWLEQPTTSGRSVWNALCAQSDALAARAAPPHGLADLSDSFLLEVVPHYRGVTAGFNAQWVDLMHGLGELAQLRGESGNSWPQRANELAHTIVDELYVHGTGEWVSISEGRNWRVGHIHDVLSVLNAFPPGALPATVRNEMMRFFRHRLQTRTWARALAATSTDCTRSVRADHGWCGSFPAWPALTALGMVRHGLHEGLEEWLAGLARSACFGPWGQAHLSGPTFVTGDAPAPKAPPEPPYQNEAWCLAGAAFGDLVLQGVFGIGLGEAQAQRNAQRLRAALDPQARLSGVRVRGQLHDL